MEPRIEGRLRPLTEVMRDGRRRIAAARTDGVIGRGEPSGCQHFGGAFAP